MDITSRADHTELLVKFNKGKEDVKDNELKDLITKTIHVVQSPLVMAKTIKGKMK